MNRYPAARDVQRHIIYHAGPTNSGKTHAALKRFSEAKSGIVLTLILSLIAQGVYCGPLRLLALEIHDRMTDRGVLCNLLTGVLAVLRQHIVAEHVQERRGETSPEQRMCHVLWRWQAQPDRWM